MWFHITGSVVVDGLIKLAAVVAALALIWNKAILPPIRFGRRVEDALQQLKPNGGSSLRDAVDRIEDVEAFERSSLRQSTDQAYREGGAA